MASSSYGYLSTSGLTHHACWGKMEWNSAMSSLTFYCCLKACWWMIILKTRLYHPISSFFSPACQTKSPSGVPTKHSTSLPSRICLSWHCWYVCIYLCIYTQIHHSLCPSINHSLHVLSYDTHTHLRLLLGILSHDLSRHLFHFASILHFGLTDCPSFRRWSRYLTRKFPISLYVSFELSSASSSIFDHAFFPLIVSFLLLTWPLCFSFLCTQTATKIPWEARMVSGQNSCPDRWATVTKDEDNLWFIFIFGIYDDTRIGGYQVLYWLGAQLVRLYWLRSVESET